MTERIFNFSAGPAVLPVPVLEKAREEMLSLPGVGMSVMEISHRSKTFDAIHQGAKAGLKELLGIPEGYHILFLQGGASLQFSMVPLNFLSDGGRAEEPRPLGRHGRHSARRPPRAHPRRPRHHARLPHAREERLALQHAEHL